MITLETAFELRKQLLNNKEMSISEKNVILNVLAGHYDKLDITVAREDIDFLNKENASKK